jgi:alpha-L-fucosidase 2
LYSLGKAVLVKAKGKNTNAFYQLPQIKEPIISSKATLKRVNIKDTFLYDIETEPGGKYILLE